MGLLFASELGRSQPISNAGTRACARYVSPAHSHIENARRLPRPRTQPHRSAANALSSSPTSASRCDGRFRPPRVSAVRIGNPLAPAAACARRQSTLPRRGRGARLRRASTPGLPSLPVDEFGRFFALLTRFLQGERLRQPLRAGSEVCIGYCVTLPTGERLQHLWQALPPRHTAPPTRTGMTGISRCRQSPAQCARNRWGRRGASGYSHRLRLPSPYR